MAYKGLFVAILLCAGCVSNPGGKLDVDSPLVPYEPPAEAQDEPEELEEEENFPVPELPGEEESDTKSVDDKDAATEDKGKKTSPKKKTTSKTPKKKG